MTNISLDASGKIDPAIADLFTSIDRMVHELEMSYFVAGATARDVVLGTCFGIDTGEATRDVDFAFLLERWEQYTNLIKRLIETGDFEPDAKMAHRLIYRATIIVDLLPFGGIEDPPGRITWPPDFAFAMTMHGFWEAYRRAVAVTVAPGLVVRFASPAGLMLLKLFAWQERHHEAHRKDARDIALLLGNYLDAGNQARLYDEHADLLEAEEFDYELAGARILGRDLGSWLPPETLALVLNVLTLGLSEKDDYPLARELPTNTSKALQLLRSFEQGLKESS